ncbi:MAG: helix-turn-helix domain-containing protein [Acidaminococcales bacterium]|jgi:AcrR family transcriptional regulator|nr:helix-turn-helix domain-containing protein [Acidaminococcales bacterium]
MLDGNLLRRLMAAKGYGMTELARACKISRSALYRKVGGKAPFTVREADILARALAMTSQERTRIFFAR